ncbi:hypothetical protein AOQ84DRAFT_386613 [Glonium stellatum]|uniref:Uncharacterized protein n=1 Tax=Glonium stellatum TaxID=574774 RepID=A0A8E2JW65_9PEZI|nr:hypothetical protein AOQ84DRAFT_386613 [Glonium stellatum]
MKRYCNSALRSGILSRWGVNPSIRAFSSSAYRQKTGGLPVFQESTSPKLSTLLETLNSNILLPRHLNADQRRLVYQKKHASRLENEPMYVQIGDVEMQLKHVDQVKDLPSRWSVLKQVVELSKDQKDWDNVVKMLEGFYLAGIHLKPRQLVKLIRRANQANMQHIVLRALQQVKTTGLSLKNPEILEAVLIGIRNKASQSGWEPESTKKALAFTEQVMELMENPEHLGTSFAKSGDPRASPLVIALPLELAVIRAARHLDGKDADGKVKIYAVRLMSAFKQDNFLKVSLPGLLSELKGPEEVVSGKTKVVVEEYYSLAEKVMKWLPVWHGLRIASSEVLGEDMPMLEDAQTVIDLVDKRLAAAADAIRKVCRSGVEPDKLPCIQALKECGR